MNDWKTLKKNFCKFIHKMYWQYWTAYFTSFHTVNCRKFKLNQTRSTMNHYDANKVKTSAANNKENTCWTWIWWSMHPTCWRSKLIAIIEIWCIERLAWFNDFFDFDHFDGLHDYFKIIYFVFCILTLFTHTWCYRPPSVGGVLFPISLNLCLRLAVRAILIFFHSAFAASRSPHAAFQMTSTNAILLTKSARL